MYLFVFETSRKTSVFSNLSQITEKSLAISDDYISGFEQVFARKKMSHNQSVKIKVEC